MKDRIGLPRGTVPIRVTPAGPVSEGVPLASRYHLSAHWRVMPSLVWKQSGKCSRHGREPHQKLCLASPSNPVLQPAESSKHAGSGEVTFSVSGHSLTTTEQSVEHWQPVSCSLFAEGRDRLIAACAVGYRWERSVCIEIRWTARANHSVGLPHKATAALAQSGVRQ